MAGSLNHIVANDGSLTLDLVENAADRLEALEECFDLVAILARDRQTLHAACASLNFPMPGVMPVAGKRAYRLSKSPFSSFAMRSTMSGRERLARVIYAALDDDNDPWDHAVRRRKGMGMADIYSANQKRAFRVADCIIAEGGRMAR